MAPSLLGAAPPSPTVGLCLSTFLLVVYFQSGLRDKSCAEAQLSAAAHGICLLESKNNLGWKGPLEVSIPAFQICSYVKKREEANFSYFLFFFFFLNYMYVCINIKLYIIKINIECNTFL